MENGQKVPNLNNRHLAPLTHTLLNPCSARPPLSWGWGPGPAPQVQLSPLIALIMY